MNSSSDTEEEQEPIAGHGLLVDAGRHQEGSQEGDSGTPKLGMFFKNAEEAFNFYHGYGIHAGFGVKCQYSKYDKEGRCRCIVLSCNRSGLAKYKRESHSSELTKKTNCKAKVQLGFRDDGFLHVRKLILEHNHPLFPGKIKDFRTKRRRKRYLYDNDKAEMPPRESWVGKRERETRGGRLLPENGDGEAIHQFFVRMQSKDSYFFHLMDWDEEGVLKNVFWADGRSRTAYQYFGDVVFVDSTCLIDKYDLPLVSFLGINHHGQYVLLGCCLLSDESSKTYLWLFKAWLACMFGRPPTSIITDRCKAMQEAVIEIFPESRYRQCVWQITKRIKENLQGVPDVEEITMSFRKIINESLTADGFEKEWENMKAKYGLEKNQWFKSLYDDRNIWAPVFIKEKFWAGMSVTLGSESMKSFFAEYVHNKFTVKQFLCKYEMITQEKYNKEAHADIELAHKSPQLITKLYVEEQLSKIYTTDMFKQFQAEVRALVYCISSVIKVDGSIHMFNVKERVRVKGNNTMEQKIYKVVFDENGPEVTCICHSFEFRGILCRHALSVICFQNLVEIPSKYIIERWRKDYKRMHALSYFPNDIAVDGQLERHENLFKCCLKLSEIGLMTCERYDFALKVVNEAIQKLIADDNLPGIIHNANIYHETATSNSFASFTLNRESYRVSSHHRTPNLMQVEQTSNHPHYEFFQDRSHTAQQATGYRTETEWRLQQFFQDSQTTEATSGPRPW